MLNDDISLEKHGLEPEHTRAIWVLLAVLAFSVLSGVGMFAGAVWIITG